MNILHLISSGGFYGAENVVAALAREQARCGHRVQVGVFENAHTPQNNVMSTFAVRGVSAIPIPCRRRVDLRTVSSIRKIIWQQAIDIVHSHGYKADMYAHLAARRMGVPLLATAHHWTRQTRAVRLYELLDGIFLRSFAAVVAVSERIAEELRAAGVPAEKIRVIDNGIELEPFSSVAATVKSELKIGEHVLIGTVGRLVEQKGITYLLAAARQLLQEFPALRFVIVGDGPDREKLEQLAKELSIADNVFFTGARVDVANVYASLDIFVLASVAEGMPMALLEAMASGAPVVATSVGAVPQIVVSGLTGALVQPRDAVGLAEAIAGLIRDPELRHRQAVAGQAKVRAQFSAGVMNRNYCSLYEQLLQEKARIAISIPSRSRVAAAANADVDTFRAPEAR